MAVVTGHMIYFSAYTRSKIFQKKIQGIRGRLWIITSHPCFRAKNYANFKFESEQVEQVHFIL